MSKEALAAVTVKAAPLHVVKSFAEAPSSMTPAPAIPLPTSFSKKPAAEAQSAEILPLHFNQKSPIATTESLPLIAPPPRAGNTASKAGAKGRFAKQQPILPLPTAVTDADASAQPSETAVATEPARAATAGNATVILSQEVRDAMVKSVLEEGLTPGAAARRFNTTWKTVTKWVNRSKETAAAAAAEAQQAAAAVEIVPLAVAEAVVEVEPTEARLETEPSPADAGAEPATQAKGLSADLRDAVVRCVLEEGLTPTAAARRFNTTGKTVAKWVRRHKEAAQAVDSPVTVQETAEIAPEVPHESSEIETPAAATIDAEAAEAVSDERAVVSKGPATRISSSDRDAIIRSVVEEGLTPGAAARRFNTTWKTVTKWVNRYKETAIAAAAEAQQAAAAAVEIAQDTVEIEVEVVTETSTTIIPDSAAEPKSRYAALPTEVREAMVRSVLEEGLSVLAAAERFGTTDKTVAKWVKRHKEALKTTSQDQTEASPAPTAPAVSETSTLAQPTLFSSEVKLAKEAKDSTAEGTVVPLEKRSGKGRSAAKRAELVQQTLPIEEPAAIAKSSEVEPKLPVAMEPSSEVVIDAAEIPVETLAPVAESAAIEPAKAVSAPDQATPTTSTELSINPAEASSTVKPFAPIEVSSAAATVAPAPHSGEVIEFPANDMAAAKDSFPAFQQRLREFYGHDIYTAWFHLLKVESMVGSKLVMSVPTRFLKSWIQSHYIDDLLKIWCETHPDVTVIELQDRSRVVARPAAQTSADPKARTGTVSHLERPTANPDRVAARTSLDARHTFETFVCGESNRLAHNAAKLAASPDAVNNSAFNPLYIHGGVGLGKTHLLQAIAAANPGRALYVTAESFMYNFIGTMRNRGLDLKHVLANVDILLMDDLQFLQGKGTVTDLALIVNAMIDAGRQVIVAADRSPGQLDCQDERLASRLKAGYCVEIGNPEEETRLGILSSHLKTDHPTLSISDELKQQLANAIVTTGRDLVGALNHLATAARLANTTVVTPEMTEAAVRQITEAQPARRVRIEDIQKVVARFYKITKDDMISARRTANVVRPRQIAIYLAKILTLRSLPEIGRRFGGRDHTTILHAVRKIEDLMGKDEAMENDVSTLKKLIGCPA